MTFESGIHSRIDTNDENIEVRGNEIRQEPFGEFFFRQSVETVLFFAGLFLTGGGLCRTRRQALALIVGIEAAFFLLDVCFVFDHNVVVGIGRVLVPAVHDVRAAFTELVETATRPCSRRLVRLDLWWLWLLLVLLMTHHHAAVVLRVMHAAAAGVHVGWRGTSLVLLLGHVGVVRHRWRRRVSRMVAPATWRRWRWQHSRMRGMGMLLLWILIVHVGRRLSQVTHGPRPRRPVKHAVLVGEAVGVVVHFHGRLRRTLLGSHRVVHALLLLWVTVTAPSSSVMRRVRLVGILHWMMH